MHLTAKEIQQSQNPSVMLEYSIYGSYLLARVENLFMQTKSKRFSFRQLFQIFKFP